ncbi:galactoside 2-alpha-L-fucosyltransferase-like protein, partial [Trifolium medium]|nr:galactoside 2-alpha-L-fucosyltransferase-like protein [Trifolium medium]
MVHLNSFKSNVTTTGSCKYIVWTHVNGLGNRMVSMAATFLYAILTDRVLLVKFQDDMVGLFCEPFLNSSWLLPNGKEFPFSTDDNGKKDFETYDSVMKRDRENNSKELLLPSVMHLKIEHTDDEHEMFFSCDHSQHLLHKVPILILRSDQYFVPSLFMGPSFGQELRKMFPNKETVFHHLGRYLFFPSNDVWGPIKRFYQAYLAKADEKIGIQSLGGLKPWVLYKIQDNNLPDSPCVQDVSMEPCYHIPPKLDCMEKPIDDDV